MICTLSACDQTANYKQTAPPMLPVQSFISDFKSKHPDWQNNSVTEEKTNNAFTGRLDAFLKADTALNGLQFTLESVNEYKPGKYAVKLVNANLPDSINLEIIGLCPPALVPKLVENKTYTFTGSFTKRFNDIKPYYDYGLWNIKTGTMGVMDDKKIYLGVTLYQIKDLKPF
jgi:hypothetical protein